MLQKVSVYPSDGGGLDLGGLDGGGGGGGKVEGQWIM